MPVQILSIHDANSDSAVLSVDLKDILGALADDLERFGFVVFSIDGTGAGVDELDARMHAAMDAGRVLWMTADELRAAAARIDQTIDAEIAAYPLDTDPSRLAASDLSAAQFPTNRMAMVIAAIDSSFFEVYLKDAALADRLAGRFRDVRRENPATYFE